MSPGNRSRLDRRHPEANQGPQQATPRLHAGCSNFTALEAGNALERPNAFSCKTFLATAIQNLHFEPRRPRDDGLRFSAPPWNAGLHKFMRMGRSREFFSVIYRGAFKDDTNTCPSRLTRGGDKLRPYGSM